MRLWVGALLVFLGAASVRAESDIELLNATLVAKFHFAEEPRDGQMVGAYQVSFRNMGDTPTNRISLLLNPGLKVEQVIGANGARLKTTSRIIPVAGFDLLELTQVEVTLPRPLIKNKPRQEIVVHYRGFLQDLSQTGLAGVKETLHPDFTMIRAQSFGYPVFAKAEQSSITKAWNHKPFHQVAFLDVPGLNTVVGNLKIAQKTTNGDITKFEMKSDRPTGMMTLAIGHYNYSTAPNLMVAYMDGSEGTAASILEGLEKESNFLEARLGAPRRNAALTVIQAPDGFQTSRAPGLVVLAGTHFSGEAVFRQGNSQDQTDLTLLSNPQGVSQVTLSMVGKGVYAELVNLWKLNPYGNSNHWGTGLDDTLVAAMTEPVERSAFWQSSYALVKRDLNTMPGMGKTPLVDFAIDGFSSEGDSTSALAFAVLHDLLGRDDFFALVRGLRADLSVGYVDMQSVADYLDMHIKDKKARQFAENWFSKGRIGRDLKKANSFDELVALYR